MKKRVQFLAVLSTAAVMTAVTPGFAANIPVFVQTAFAASTGWVEEDGELRYLDRDGYYLTDTWKKRDNEWYYLNEDGYISRSMMIDEYYVDEDGKRVSNRWIGEDNDEEWDDEAPDTYWYYFGKDGKSIVSKWYTIDGKNYYFNDDGHMQTGKITLDGFTYYLGEEGDGVMKTGWIQLENENEDAEEDMVWHFFDSKGRMVMNQVDRKIGSAYYTFENGIMQTGWYKLPAAAAETPAPETEEEDAETATGSNASADSDIASSEASAAEDAEAAASTEASAAEGAEAAASSDVTSSVSEISADAPAIASYQYYAEDGKRAEGWYEIEGAPDVSEEGEVFTFYFKEGRPYHAATGVQTFNINSKRYAFNTNGEMQTDLQVVTLENGATANYYFGEDGVMRTGKQNIYNEDSGETETWFFLTDGGNKGQGFHGVRDNNVYRQGLRLDADRDLRYAPVELDGVSYLVNASGTIQKASSSSKSSEKPELGSGYKDFKDSNDKIWTVNANGVIQN